MPKTFFKLRKFILIFPLITILIICENSRAEKCADLLFNEISQTNYLNQGFGNNGNNGFSNNKINKISLANKEGRETDVFGSSSILKKVNSSVLKAEQILNILGGESTNEVKVAASLFGSVAQPKSLMGFSDVDIETILVVQTQPGRGENLNSSRSPEIKLLTQYFKNHIETVIKENPNFIFIELKAGEFINPVDNEVHGIKWNLSEIRQGSKIVYEKNNLRTVTLEEAFTENARIKADWAIPSIQNKSPLGAYQEASVVYRLGIQVGRNQPRLKPLFYGDVVPFRETVIAFDPDEINLIEATSKGVKSPPVEEIHRKFIESLSKLPDPFLHKLLKRLYVLLQFWESPEFTSLALGRKLTHSQIESEIIEILRNPNVVHLAQLKSQGQLFQVLEEHKIMIPNQSLETWLSNFPDTNNLDLVVKKLDQQLNQKISGLLENKSDLKLYLKVIKDRIALSLKKLEPQPVFISLIPHANWLHNYELNLPRWKKDYPQLEFEEPQNLHMTLYFLGLMTPLAIDKIKSLIPLPSKKWTFREGGVHVFGQQNDALVVLFNEVNRSIADLHLLRSQVVSMGARPTTDYVKFRPHITIAKLNKSNLADAIAERDAFLANEGIFNMEEVEVSDMGIYKRNPEAKTGEPAYIKR
jgi:2'-5' RNA ligase